MIFRGIYKGYFVFELIKEQYNSENIFSTFNWRNTYWHSIGYYRNSILKKDASMGYDDADFMRYHNLFSIVCYVFMPWFFYGVNHNSGIAFGCIAT